MLWRASSRVLQGSSQTVCFFLSLAILCSIDIEELQDTADDNRLVPEFDASAMDPGDIYPLHNIIPEAEWKALSVSAFESASSEKEKIALLPYRRSDWIFQHVKNLPSLPDKTRKRHM